MKSKPTPGTKNSVNTKPKPGEVWVADFGMIGKPRPVLVLASPGQTDARSLVVVVPLTSQIRALPGEVDIGKPKWLPKHSAVNVQGLASFDHNKLTRKCGKLSEAHFQEVKDAICELLQL